MYIKKKFARIAVALLAVILIACQLGIFSIAAEEPASEKTVVIAGSDFQSSSSAAGAMLVGLMLKSMKNNGGIESADGFLFCGDYARSSQVMADNKDGVQQLKNAVSGFVPEENMVFAQGNHDCAIGTAGMSPSGDNDPASGKYGVYVINEDDYMWENTDKDRIIETASLLEDYLSDKLEEKFSAPIFIVSHLPLHTTMRTKEIGDAQYANYIFDVINAAGEQGLNIVFLFGHDHGDGWDDYLGGSSVYLAKGDEIVIAHGSMSSLSTETLNFYYMNAGYVGYYAECNEGADCALTMTSFTFDDQSMEITRYTPSKIHNLKSAGVLNAHKNENKYGYYEANTDVYPSPQTIKLNDLNSTPDMPENDEDNEPPIIDTPEIESETGMVPPDADDPTVDKGDSNASTSASSTPSFLIALATGGVGILLVSAVAICCIIGVAIILAILVAAAVIVAVIVLRRKKRQKR